MCWTYCWSHVLPTFLDFCCAFSYDPFGDKMSSTEVIFEKWPHNLCEPRQWSCFSWGINFTDPCLCFKHLRLMCDISLWRFSSDNHKYLKAYPHLQNAFLQKLPDIYIYILKKRTGIIKASNETSNAISAPSNRFDVYTIYIHSFNEILMIWLKHSINNKGDWVTVFAFKVKITCKSAL